MPYMQHQHAVLCVNQLDQNIFSQYEYDEGSEKSFRLTTGPLQVKLEKLFVTNDDN